MEQSLVAYQQRRAAFAAMLDERKWPLTWLDEEIASGRATAFSNEHGCIIAALRRYPGGLVEVHGLAATGNLLGIRDLIKDAEIWGKANGASVASIASRRGWAKVLAGAGYVESQVMIEKELANGA